MENIPGGKEWIAASRSALFVPVEVAAPYRQKGFFYSDKPRSLGLKFSAKRGEQVHFNLTKNQPGFVIYADVFKADGSFSSPLLTVDTAASEFDFNSEEEGDYIIRLQPELFAGGEYSLSITKTPSLGFPVSGDKAKIGSFWGADRDGGKRSHEGIDIFAPKRTPVVASADGRVTGVKEGGIGGKTVWLRVADQNLTLYYAHLDEQLVREGQQVKKGDVLGTVGNTGNAKTTPPHLHFGIYTFSGAIDPLAFVKPLLQKSPTVPEKNMSGRELKLKKKQVFADSLYGVNTVLVPLAITPKGYIAEIPGGRNVIAPFNAVN